MAGAEASTVVRWLPKGLPVPEGWHVDHVDPRYGSRLISAPVLPLADVEIRSHEEVLGARLAPDSDVDRLPRAGVHGRRRPPGGLLAGGGGLERLDSLASAGVVALAVLGLVVALAVLSGALGLGQLGDDSDAPGERVTVRPLR